MRWKDVEVGDYLIDNQFKGNDHVLAWRDNDYVIWIRISDGTVSVDKDTEFNDEILEGWSVYRDGRFIWNDRP